MSKRKHVVACFGDSTTGGSSTSFIQHPQYLKVLLGYQYATINLGVGGETASQISTRVTTHSTQFTTAPTRTAIILGGINDIASGTAAATVFSTLTGAVDTLVGQSWDKIILCTPAPAGSYAGLSAGEQTALESLRTSILAYTNTNTVIADVYSQLEDVATAGQLSYLGGTKPDYATSSVSPFGRDFLHFNNAGHSAIADLIAPLITGA